MSNPSQSQSSKPQFTDPPEPELESNSQSTRWTILFISGCFAAFICFILVRQSSNTVVVGSNWPENSLIAIEQFDHQPLSELLSKYVSASGTIDYERWHKNEKDRLALLSYLQTTSRIYWNQDRTPKTEVVNAPQHELAFWINVYNALTIHAILHVYPTESVRRHTNPLGFNIWNHLKLRVGAHNYSLAEIESGPLRKFDDLRIQLAIVKGSASCPGLLNHTFDPSKIDSQLNERAFDFFKSESNLRFEGKDRIHLNPILRAKLGEMTVAEIGEHLIDIVPETKIVNRIKGSVKEVFWMKHDWSLNQK